MRKLIDNKTAKKIDKLNEYPFERWYIDTPSPTVYQGEYVTSSTYELKQVAPNEPYTTYTHRDIQLATALDKLSLFSVKVIAGDDMDGDYSLRWNFELNKPITKTINISYYIDEAKSPYMTTLGGKLQELKTGYGKANIDGRDYEIAHTQFNLPNEFYAFSLRIEKINGIIYIDVNEL